MVCFSNVEWGTWRQRHHHLMERFARRRPVLYVETLGMRSPSLLSLQDLRRMGQRVGRAALQPRATRAAVPQGEAGGNLWVYSPLVIPYHQLAGVRRFNARVLIRDLHRVFASRGIVDPVLWIYLPTELIVSVTERIPHRLLVYDCIDAITEFRDAPAELARSERRLIRRADLVLASSRRLEDRCREDSSAVHYLPNAGDIHRFRPTAGPTPDDLARIPGPRVGYVGAIREWFDTELLACAARRYPDASFVLIGDDVSSLPVFRSLPNVHVLGPRPYDRLPAYVAALDVCLIPFRGTELVRSTHPIKVYEYLGAGKPVVATPMEEIAQLQEVDIAHGEHFLDAIGRYLQDPGGTEDQERRRRSVMANTWDARFDEVNDLLAAALQTSPSAATAGP